jgi:hypothetical protein
MASLIQIKRSITATQPNSLANGEIAYSGNTQSDSLFIGNPNGGAVTRIAGKKFGHLHSANLGQVTANAVVLTDSNNFIDQLNFGNSSVNAVVNSSVLTVGNSTINAIINSTSIAVNKVIANGASGTSGQLLYSGGSGNTYWAAPSATVTGSNTQVQFNDSGASGATSDFTFDKDAKNLRVANSVILGLVGGSEATVNSTIYTGKAWTANNSDYLGGTAAASYQLNSTLSDNVRTLTANNANNLGGQLPAYYTNATNIDSGTLNTARLPATANISTAINVGANVNLSTSDIRVGNSTVNTIINGSSLSVNGSVTTKTLSTGNLTISVGAVLTGDIIPATDQTYSLGNTTHKFKDLYLSGNTLSLGNTTLSDSQLQAIINSISTTGNAYFGNVMTVVGNATFQNTISVTGNATFSNTIAVTGSATFSNTINVAGKGTFSMDLQVDGDTILGTSTADKISINGYVNTNITPHANVTYDLGTQALSWKTIHANNVHTQYATIDQDLTVSGNLTVTGTFATINVSTLSVTDALIQLASNNTGSDTLDIGFFGSYQTGGGDHEHTGLFRDATDGVYRLFDNLQATPTTTVDTSNNTFRIASLQAYLNSGAFTSNSTAVTLTANSTVDVNITANTLSLSTALPGTSGGTGLSSYTTEDILVANSSNGFRKLGIGTEGYILQVSSGVLAYGTMDGGSF